MGQFNGTVPLTLTLCEHPKMHTDFSNVCAFCPIKECERQKSQKISADFQVPLQCVFLCPIRECLYFVRVSPIKMC